MPKTMSNHEHREENTHNALEPLLQGPEHVKAIIMRILTLERERLYQQRPHLNEDVIRIIKEEVK